MQGQKVKSYLGPVTKPLEADDPRLQKIFAHIEDHLDDPLSVEQLAELVDLSESCLSRTFKQATGLTTCEYVRRQRVQRAKDLLLNNEQLSLVDIALRVGFADQPHMTRQFKQVTGISPAAFRLARTDAKR